MKNADISQCPIVVKVGGSLYDLPDLGPRLHHLLDALDTCTILMVPGGGALADAIRCLDKLHGLGEEAAHWLALRALSVNAQFLAKLLGLDVVGHPDSTWRERVCILDCHAFAAADDGEPGALPHRWQVTSDSIAARAARRIKAQRLVLLKSISIPVGTNWHDAARCGWVDEFFAEAVGNTLEVRVFNLRELTLYQDA